MKIPQLLTSALATLLLVASGICPVSAELQTLNRPPWLEYHSAYVNRNYQISLTGQGEITLELIGDTVHPLEAGSRQG